MKQPPHPLLQSRSSFSYLWERAGVRGLFLISLFICMGCLSACHKTQTDNQQSIIFKVEAKPLVNTLYYSGNLLPEDQVSVISPNDGVVVMQKFNYGQIVQAGQPLFVIDSSKQAQDFQQALSEYLKAKETLNNTQANWKNTQSLYTKGLVSRNEFTQAKSDYYVNELSFIQAQQQLQQAVRFYHTDKNIFALSIEDIHGISEELKATDALKNITINAPASGVALFPASTSNSSSDTGQQKVSLGSEVKQSQLLLTIGHPDGLSIKVQANQTDINQLHTGLPAIVTSIAFPNITLQGYISSMDMQATTDSNNMPVFNMVIVIPKLDEAAKKVVKIGMSAKVEIDITSSAQMTIPISAVSQVNGHSVVTKIVDGKKITQSIETGQTTSDSVVVTKGLKSGDEIVSGH